MSWHLPLVVAALVSTGCSGSVYRLVPVSGVVTLDGQPLPNARVAFEPIASSGSVVAGPGSYAQTDSSGRYTLADVSGRSGAVVGQHRVSISTARIEEDLATGRSKVIAEERVPKRYEEADALVGEVPPGGTDTANFHLTTQ